MVDCKEEYGRQGGGANNDGGTEEKMVGISIASREAVMGVQ